MTRNKVLAWIFSPLVILTAHMAFGHSSQASDISSGLLFDSTNLSVSDDRITVSVDNVVWAFQFSAFEAAEVEEIEFLFSPNDELSFELEIAAATFDGTVVGAFGTPVASVAVPCPTNSSDITDCQRATFRGSASLSVGTYWLRFTNGAGTQILQFRGAAATRSGLPLGHTLGSNDIVFDGFGMTDTLNSISTGYPQVRMCAASCPSGVGPSDGSTMSARHTLEYNAISGECTVKTSGLVASGVWTQVPSDKQCTNPEHTLLGWATTSNFPIEIAQRQKDNGWGTYELFDEDGILTTVYIPAGDMTVVTGDNVLYAIWKLTM